MFSDIQLRKIVIGLREKYRCKFAYYYTTSKSLNAYTL